MFFRGGITEMRATLENLQDKIPNKYKLCLVAARRAKMITNGAPPLLFTKNIKPTTIALEEILNKKVTIKEGKKSKSKQ
ncbi:MAG: DNA-directed RNA polymerase subunit omega [Candidatus Hydrogenedentota bacterium]